MPLRGGFMLLSLTKSSLRRPRSRELTKVTDSTASISQIAETPAEQGFRSLASNGARRNGYGKVEKAGGCWGFRRLGEPRQTEVKRHPGSRSEAPRAAKQPLTKSARPPLNWGDAILC